MRYTPLCVIHPSICLIRILTSRILRILTSCISRMFKFFKINFLESDKSITQNNQGTYGIKKNKTHVLYGILISKK
jgi:hypothetical protein